VGIVHANNSSDDIDDEIVEKILQKYDGKQVDGAGRGRTAASVMNRFGLSVAVDSKGPVIITDLGKQWLAHELDDQTLFTHFFLKWQYPNRIETGYSDFDIKPFVGVLALITLVNELWIKEGNEPVGLSKEEYKLFAPSLQKFSDVVDYANQIIEYRRAKKKRSGKDLTDFVKKFALERAVKIFGSRKDTDTALSDLRDYTDSSIRYFRVSSLICLRGHDTHVDIAKDKTVEVESILKNIKLSAESFSSFEEYLHHLSDIGAIQLPWQNESDLEKIVFELKNALQLEFPNSENEKFIHEIAKYPSDKKVVALEQRLNDLRIQNLRTLKHNLSVLDDCINKLQAITQRNYEPLTARPSLDFEWYVSQSLMVMNDAINIHPSFNLGDDGIPTGFRANTSDIRCYYKSFSMTVEVTLLNGRDQWVAEGQPVMRHLRDFENEEKNKEVFCLFVAPFLHRDTLNTFWISNKFQYEGRKQKIIPLTLLQFIDLLKFAKGKIEQNILTNESLKNLFQSLIERVDMFETYEEWLSKLPELTNAWVASKVH
jgi:hypothetical protein